VRACSPRALTRAFARQHNFNIYRAARGARPSFA
jgi:hypothetical protein